MIDLHSHLLPGIDDGAQTLEDALTMARQAVADGTTILACTPHIYPGLFPNTPDIIDQALLQLKQALKDNDIPLEVVSGADIQIIPELVSQLRSGELPTLNNTRYFLFEPPHHVPNSAMLELVHNSVAAGFVPVITHPERLSYAFGKYREFSEAVASGAWLQLTGNAITGHFGPDIAKLSERFLRDGLVHIVASDTHDARHRPPILSHAYQRCCELVGEEETERLFVHRPRAILDNASPVDVAPPAPLVKATGLKALFARWLP